MSDPHRLAEIKEWRSYHSSPEVTPYAQVRLADIDWLVGEVERLRGLEPAIDLRRQEIELPRSPAVTDPDRLAEAKETVKRLAAEADRIYKPGGDPEVERLRDDVTVAMRLAAEEAAEGRRLHGLLARLEWAGTLVFDEWYKVGLCCPVCRAEEGDPHGNCWLADELNR